MSSAAACSWPWALRGGARRLDAVAQGLLARARGVEVAREHGRLGPSPFERLGDPQVRRRRSAPRRAGDEHVADQRVRERVAAVVLDDDVGGVRLVERVLDVLADDRLERRGA